MRIDYTRHTWTCRVVLSPDDEAVIATTDNGRVACRLILAAFDYDDAAWLVTGSGTVLKRDGKPGTALRNHVRIDWNELPREIRTAILRRRATC